LQIPLNFDITHGEDKLLSSFGDGLLVVASFHLPEGIVYTSSLSFIVRGTGCQTTMGNFFWRQNQRVFSVIYKKRPHFAIYRILSFARRKN
jgi:hypothetical protein